MRIEELVITLLEGQIRTDQSLNTLIVTVDKYVQASDERMKRIEDNLDGLIRAITQEHNNGKGQE
jgi:hypothetical protein